MWRSMNELAGSPAFTKYLNVEFPVAAGADDVDRRNFIKLMGASMALAGVTGCTKQPTEHIVPYVSQPESLIPGRPQFYATALPTGGFGRGVLVESHMGRPTKIEGNPEHPGSLGATDIWMQARILEMYDPDRSQVIKHMGRISTWDKYLMELKPKLDAFAAKEGQGMRILTGDISSPTLTARIASLKAKYPKAGWHCHEPVSRDALYQGTELAFGEKLEAQYDLKDADVILSLDSDFLFSGPAALNLAKAFAARREVDTHHTDMNRLYVLECSPSVTGSIADHRLALVPADLAAFAQDLASRVGVSLDGAAQSTHTQWVAAIAEDLKHHMGRCVVIAGDYQPAEIHALAHAMNSALGAVGRTVRYTQPVLSTVNDASCGSLAALVQDINAGDVDALFVIDANPAYSAPADLDFAAAYQKVAFRVHHGLHEDETAMLSHWHSPSTHVLETWGDVRAFDGTVTIMQPLIEALYGGKNACEFVDVLLGQAGIPSYDAVKATWEARLGTLGFAAIFKTSIHDGLVANTAFAPKAVSITLDQKLVLEGLRTTRKGDTLVLRPDPSIWDGTYANNGWLQELPKPLSKITWENAALVSPAYAKEHGLSDGDVVTVAVEGRSVTAPTWIVPGHAPHAVTLYLGYGREHAGRVGNGAGANAYALQSSLRPWNIDGVTLVRTGEKVTMACTQDHHSMEGRRLVRTGSLDTFKDNPDFVKEMDHDLGEGTSLYPLYKYDGYKWGMVIDLGACLGCNACTTACQAENNITVVGKDQVSRGREMHWIRIDRYFEGELDSPEIHHQPVACMHCEQAPCEPVCPVGATTHSDEGLNDMIYNRCVGTRYCSNNCPYKVRRFNFLHYNDDISESKKLMRNPDVTVRMRGVMEKCTFCVQRINAARITAKNQGRKIREGDVVTACQQACPTGAITFGDLNDPKSKVTRLAAHKLNYAMLGELGVRPRTTYLAKIKNTNSALAPNAPAKGSGHDNHHG